MGEGGRRGHPRAWPELCVHGRSRGVPYKLFILKKKCFTSTESTKIGREVVPMQLSHDMYHLFGNVTNEASPPPSLRSISSRRHHFTTCFLMHVTVFASPSHAVDVDHSPCPVPALIMLWSIVYLALNPAHARRNINDSLNFCWMAGKCPSNKCRRQPSSGAMTPQKSEWRVHGRRRAHLWLGSMRIGAKWLSGITVQLRLLQVVLYVQKMAPTANGRPRQKGAAVLGDW